jgi:hypothetical protein
MPCETRLHRTAIPICSEVGDWVTFVLPTQSRGSPWLFPISTVHFLTALSIPGIHSFQFKPLQTQSNLAMPSSLGSQIGRLLEKWSSLPSRSDQSGQPDTVSFESRSYLATVTPGMCVSDSAGFAPVLKWITNVGSQQTTRSTSRRWIRQRACGVCGRRSSGKVLGQAS